MSLYRRIDIIAVLCVSVCAFCLAGIVLHALQLQTAHNAADVL